MTHFDDNSAAAYPTEAPDNTDPKDGVVVADYSAGMELAARLIMAMRGAEAPDTIDSLRALQQFSDADLAVFNMALLQKMGHASHHK